MFVADWYAIPGGMQDLNYWGYGCSEITVELTCCKYPPANELPQIWLDNRKALLEYLKVANTGIKGIVKFSSGKPAENISVKFDSREPYFKTNKNGEYYRILLDGNYKMSLMLGCDLIYESDVTIKDGLLVKNITLSAKAEAISTKYNLIRQPVFCKQEVKSCKTYNNKETIPDKSISIVLPSVEPPILSGSNDTKISIILIFSSLFILLSTLIF